ncbi:MAG: hypothetical protein QXP31_10740 [Pyrobaculum sp.]
MSDRVDRRQRAEQVEEVYLPRRPEPPRVRHLWRPPAGPRVGIWTALAVLFIAAFVYIAPLNQQAAAVYFLTPAAVVAALAKMLNQRISTVGLIVGLVAFAAAMLYLPGWAYALVRQYVKLSLEDATLLYAVVAVGVLTPYVLTLVHVAVAKRRYAPKRRRPEPSKI